MQPIDATKQEYEVMLLFDTPVLFTGRRIIPATIPAGMYAYEIQFNEDGEPTCVADKIESHYFGGTALSVEPIGLNEYDCRTMHGNLVLSQKTQYAFRFNHTI